MGALRRRVARHRHKRLLRRMAGRRLMSAFARAHADARFVEIGAHEGGRLDLLAPYVRDRGWRGVMVEPVPYVFERLRRRYGDVEGVALANVAIAGRDGRLPFYHLAEAPPEERAGLPDWYDELGSFSRETVLRHADRIPGLEDRLVETEVPCLSFETLVRRYGPERVDLLLMDTEGHDWEILRTIDLAVHRPRLLVYEHFHLGAGDRERALELVRSHGYEVLEEGLDTFCLDVGRQDGLTTAFRRLRPALAGLSAHDR